MAIHDGHTYGFTRIDGMTEWRFAKVLRAEQAIDRWQKVGASNWWRDPNNRVVAIAYYSGPGGMNVTYYLRDAIAKRIRTSLWRDKKQARDSA
jgi:hypothetical protein